MAINKNEILNYSFDNFLREEYTDKILEIRRVTKVVKGGKKFSFRAVVATGDLKEKVGLFASKIRQISPPEPYKGKGICYENETIRRKIGKTGK